MNHGLFDLQVNGFAGVDFQRPEITRADLERATEALRRHQTTGILFTLITDTVDALVAQLERVERIRAESPSVRGMIAGYHIEGPYLLPELGYHGAHDPRKMKAPDRGEFDRLQRSAGGRIRLMTLAPEWPGSPDFIRHLVASGVTASIGHSNAVCVDTLSHQNRPCRARESDGTLRGDVDLEGREVLSHATPDERNVILFHCREPSHSIFVVWLCLVQSSSENCIPVCASDVHANKVEVDDSRGAGEAVVDGHA